MMQQAKPFVKWAGGKSNLLSQLTDALPPELSSCNACTYIEPFVGGGALLFHLLRLGISFRKVVINDINTDLMQCYRLIKDSPEMLVDELQRIESLHNKLDSEQGQAKLYYSFREHYNKHSNIPATERAALFLYLNHTCFNGLHRVNKEGKFNVPYAFRKKPNICNKKVIMADSEILNQTDIIILHGDYERVEEYVTAHTFVYLDPPYKPLSATSYFKEYSNQPFNDEQQELLKMFCDRLNQRNAWFMLSNSDARNEDGTSYFDQLYQGYHRLRVDAPRYINAKGDGRKALSELLITNYPPHEQQDHDSSQQP